MRNLVRETRLSPSDFILPLFVSSEKDANRPITALPGCNVLSGRPLAEFAKTIRDHDVPAVLLFAIATPEERDLTATSASNADGPVQKALMQLKDAVPDLVLIADLCHCEYKSDGHCGILNNGRIDNDATLDRIGEIATALTSLDIIRDARENFSTPIAAYHVSGESAMIRAAGEQGYLNAEDVMMESLVCIKRAGADMIITYSALDAISRL